MKKQVIKMVGMAAIAFVTSLSANVLAADIDQNKAQKSSAVKTSNFSGKVPNLSGPAVSKQVSPNNQFSSDQTEAIQNIVRSYLVAHPEVLEEAAQAWHKQEMKQAHEAAMTAIQKYTAQIFKDPATPIAGNPKGTIQIVEFFDYQCAHCKEMKPVIENLIKNNKDVKLVFKQLPIFGETSQYAAKAALAANQQPGKYFQFHEALLGAEGGLNADKVKEIAEKSGVNVKKMSKEMNKEDISQQLKDNFILAEELKLAGTPAFILANKDLTRFEFVPGSTSEESLQKMIDRLSGKVTKVAPKEQE